MDEALEVKKTKPTDEGSEIINLKAKETVRVRERRRQRERARTQERKRKRERERERERKLEKNKQKQREQVLERKLVKNQQKQREQVLERKRQRERERQHRIKREKERQIQREMERKEESGMLVERKREHKVHRVSCRERDLKQEKIPNLEFGKEIRSVSRRLIRPPSRFAGSEFLFGVGRREVRGRVLGGDGERNEGDTTEKSGIEISGKEKLEEKEMMKEVVRVEEEEEDERKGEEEEEEEVVVKMEVEEVREVKEQKQEEEQKRQEDTEGIKNDIEEESKEREGDADDKESDMEREPLILRKVPLRGKGEIMEKEAKEGEKEGDSDHKESDMEREPLILRKVPLSEKGEMMEKEATEGERKGDSDHKESDMEREPLILRKVPLSEKGEMVEKEAKEGEKEGDSDHKESDMEREPLIRRKVPLSEKGEMMEKEAKEGEREGDSDHKESDMEREMSVLEIDTERSDMEKDEGKERLSGKKKKKKKKKKKIKGPNERQIGGSERDSGSSLTSGVDRGSGETGRDGSTRSRESDRESGRESGERLLLRIPAWVWKSGGQEPKMEQEGECEREQNKPEGDFGKSDDKKVKLLEKFEAIMQEMEGLKNPRAKAILEKDAPSETPSDLVPDEGSACTEVLDCPVDREVNDVLGSGCKLDEDWLKFPLSPSIADAPQPTALSYSPQPLSPATHTSPQAIPSPSPSLSPSVSPPASPVLSSFSLVPECVVRVRRVPVRRREKRIAMEPLTPSPRIKHVCRRASVALQQPRASLPSLLQSISPSESPAISPALSLTLSALPLDERDAVLSRLTDESSDLDSDGGTWTDRQTDLPTRISTSTCSAAAAPGNPLGPRDELWIPGKNSKKKKSTHIPENRVRKRLGRCGYCAGCQVKIDCGSCPHCLDKPKFGGPNIRKQCCIYRKCDHTRKGRAEMKDNFRRMPSSLRPALAPLDSWRSRPDVKGHPIVRAIPLSRKLLERTRRKQKKALAGTIAHLSPSKSIAEEFAGQIKVDFNQEESSIRKIWGAGGLSLLASSPHALSLPVCLLCGSAGLNQLQFCGSCCEAYHSFCLNEVDSSSESGEGSDEENDGESAGGNGREGAEDVKVKNKKARMESERGKQGGEVPHLESSGESVEGLRDIWESGRNRRVWRCRLCLCCMVCGGEGTNLKLLTCSHCFSTFHPDCLGPAYPCQPLGSPPVWFCPRCVCCHICMSRSDTWANGFSVCMKCTHRLSGSPCTICDAKWIMGQGSSALLCTSCPRWSHDHCSGLTAFDLSLPDCPPFLCSQCDTLLPLRKTIQISLTHSLPCSLAHVLLNSLCSSVPGSTSVKHNADRLAIVNHVNMIDSTAPNADQVCVCFFFIVRTNNSTAVVDHV
uniref:Uncharacterized protein n=1 Tax=Eptatretus burgeri TaxID=7764 RepID=A0A8C4QDF7_EPTBU